MTPRPALRRTLLLAGILPALLVLAFGVKVGLMVQHDRDGRDAFERGDHDGSQREFAANRSLNLLEPWVAPFDEGTAHHVEGQYDAAVLDYESALDDVPEREECTVRINLALAHESIGDALAEQRDPEGAVESWEAGIDALADGGCPQSSGRGEDQTRDAETLDRRLRSKTEQQEQPQPGERPRQPTPEGQDGERPQDPRQEQLERNNERGQEQRREDRELYDDLDTSRPYSW